MGLKDLVKGSYHNLLHLQHRLHLQPGATGLKDPVKGSQGATRLTFQLKVTSP